jgi:hypothetical protein
MVEPHNQNPRGERLTPVLLQQGLVLSPPSLGQFGKMASIKDKIKTRESSEGECCYSKAISSNPRRKTALSVDNLGLGHLLPLEF